METKTISEFLSSDYKDFAMYVVESRAIPSVIDGLKPTQRKIVHGCAGIWKDGSEKALKVFQLAGKVASDCFYHHGNCLDPDTNILLSNGEIISIFDWFSKYPNIKLEVVSYDEKRKEFTTSIGHSPRIGNITNVEFELEMMDGSVIKCTENHPFLTKRGWVEAMYLKEDDEIISMSRP